MLQWFCTALVAKQTFAAVVIEENDLDCHYFCLYQTGREFHNIIYKFRTVIDLLCTTVQLYSLFALE